MKFEPGDVSQLRARLGYNQTEFGAFVAESLGMDKPVSRVAVGRWEAGQRVQSAKVYQFVADLLEKHVRAAEAAMGRLENAAEMDRMRRKIAGNTEYMDQTALERMLVLSEAEADRCRGVQRVA